MDREAYVGASFETIDDEDQLGRDITEGEISPPSPENDRYDDCVVKLSKEVEGVGIPVEKLDVESTGTKSVVLDCNAPSAEVDDTATGVGLSAIE